jgi:hypothetical protein
MNIEISDGLILSCFQFWCFRIRAVWPLSLVDASCRLMIDLSVYWAGWSRLFCLIKRKLISDHLLAGSRMNCF